MHSHSVATGVKRDYSRAMLAAMTLLSAVVVVSAQGGVGSTRGLPDSAAGIHSIQGHVFYPSGRRAGQGINIKLEGNATGSRSAATDADG